MTRDERPRDERHAQRERRRAYLLAALPAPVALALPWIFPTWGTYLAAVLMLGWWTVLHLWPTAPPSDEAADPRRV